MSPQQHSTSSSSSSSSSSMAKQVRYKGLFSPQAAPTTRAYCLLMSFLLGTLMLTAGSVFYHVILSKPMSGSRPMHTPPLPLALTLIVAGLLTLLTCLTVAAKYGCDDGDESLEEDLCSITKDDVLDQEYRSTSDTNPKEPSCEPRPLNPPGTSEKNLDQQQSSVTTSSSEVPLSL